MGLSWRMYLKCRILSPTWIQTSYNEQCYFIMEKEAIFREVGQLVKMHIPRLPHPMESMPEGKGYREGGDGSQELALPATSQDDFEAGPLQASLQEPVHLPKESYVPFESPLWKTMSVIVPRWVQGHRTLKSDTSGIECWLCHILYDLKRVT